MSTDPQPITWRTMLATIMVDAYTAFVDQHPELADTPVLPGADLVFNVDTPLGAIPVTFKIPAPLATSLGTQVMFRDAKTTTLPVHLQTRGTA
jgi:hypothetical protein